MQQKISLFLIDLALILLTVSAKPFYFYQKIPRVIHKIEIKIKGNTTVGKYTCATILYKKDTLNLEALEKNTIKATIPMTSIDCGHRIMTKDLQSTVKVKTFPNSYVTISNLKFTANNTYKCTLVFTLTNKTLTYKDFVLTYSKSTQQATGILPLTFSDLGLSPPVKMGGIIKVKNEIEVNFDLFFK